MHYLCESLRLRGSLLLVWNAASAKKMMMKFTRASKIPAAYLQHSYHTTSLFFKISVAFFFKRSIELAHQASKPCFGNKTGATSRNVNDALGVQKQMLFALEVTQPLVRR
jgi:hypothetical protein